MRGGKRVVITYGTYDLLHHGHIRLMERAKELGDYLIVGVTSDAFDKSRGKLNVEQPFSERLRAVQDAGIADLVIAEEFQGQKIADIKKYGVDVFAIGSDWEGRFDHLGRYCDVVYLPRTQGVSSTELRAERSASMELCCIGSGYLMERFTGESRHVAGVEVTCGFSPTGDNSAFEAAGVPVAKTLSDALERCTAVYICEPIDERAGLIRCALEAGKHVLCEAPMFLSLDEGRDLFALADERGLVLMEALKTAYFPAFERLQLLLENGIVGEVKDVDASFSHVFDGLNRADRYEGSFYDMGATVCLPAMAFLGIDYQDARFACAFDGDFCTWAKLDLAYDTASATLRVGRGMKTEGDMVVTGTDGYVYVPAPWWKTEYFEVRHEDLRDTKKYYFDYAGEGLRYELFEFAHLAATEPAERIPARGEGEVLAVAALVEQFDQGRVRRLEKGAWAFNGGETVVDR